MAPEPSDAHREGDDEPTPLDLGLAIIGEVPVFSAHDLDAGGIGLSETRRLWRALGLPLNDEAVTFTRTDVAILSALLDAVDRGTVDLDTVVNLARATGQTMARLADWQISTVLPHLEQRAVEGLEPRSSAARQVVEELRDLFEQVLVNSWRRHLAAAVGRNEILRHLADDSSDSAQVTVAFADLVSFTALSNQLDEGRIGDLVEKFESRCHDVIQTHEGRLIKSLGDSVLYVNSDPVRAIETAEGIIKVIGRDSRLPDVRVGLASGHVVTRLGDVFGPPVNLAARLTPIARRNRMIIDAETARLLPPEDFEVRALPARPVRGFGLLEPLTVRRT